MKFVLIHDTEHTKFKKLSSVSCMLYWECHKHVLQNYLLFVILQQKMVIKRDNDVDTQSEEESFNMMQRHEVYVPKAEPVVGPVSRCFYSSCLCMFFFFGTCHS
jgi:hypothetical protein